MTANTTSRNISKKLLHSAIVAALTLSFGVTQSWAQTADDEDEEDEIVQEIASDRIVVTGSRIARDEFSSASPIQVIDGEVARDLGLVDASDILRQTTVVQGQQTTTAVSTSAGLLTSSGPGSAAASLRGLGSGRTLVLVNGRRLAPAGVRGVPSAPDLNMIPGSLIQRTEILLDGASSVYGSDAVSGVVNYILRSDFDGVQLDAFVTSPKMDGNTGQRLVNMTWGTTSDRGFMGLAVEHSSTDGFTQRDVGSFIDAYAGNCRSGFLQGASGEIYEFCTASFGVGAVQSGFGFLIYDENAAIPGFPAGFRPLGPLPPGLIAPDSPEGQALLLFPEELDAVFQPDFERTNFYAIGEYSPGFYGDMTAYFEASHSSRRTSTRSSGQGSIRVPGDYALGSFGGRDATLFVSRQIEAETEVAQTRLIGGVRGDLPFLDSVGSLGNWFYDVYGSYSRSTGTDVVSGIPFFPRLEQTISNSFFNEATGQFDCRSRSIPGVAQPVTCRPLNFFDPDFIFSGRFSDPADDEYLFPNRITNTVVEQSVISGYASGELFNLSFGGPVSLVIGFEYRQDDIRTDTDAGASAGDFQGFFADPGANGGRWLREGFLELDVPLLRDFTFARELSLNFAGRYTEEENFGSAFTYRAQALWAPTSWARVRGTYGTSFRAPNLGEQFGGRVTGFGNPQDPCRVPGIAVPFVPNPDDPDGPEIRLYNPDLDPREPLVIANCLNGGGPFGLPGTDPFELGVRGLGGPSPSFFGAPTRIASGSNPDLDPETSTAWSAGFVMEQPWTDRFDARLSVTYFNIEVDDEINQLGASTIVNRCYNSEGLTDPTCQFITRDPRVADDDTSGEISFVEALNQNLGKQNIEGIDYNLELGADFSLPGFEQQLRLDFIGRATRSLTQDEEEIRVADIFVLDRLGTFGNPKWRASLTGIVGYGDWSFLWQSRYIGRQRAFTDRRDPLIQTSPLFPCVADGDGPCTRLEDLDNYWVHSLSASWRGANSIVRVGVNNVFNDQPPRTTFNSLGDLGGIGYDLSGRTYFANVTYAF